jgi:hypothetical protein
MRRQYASILLCLLVAVVVVAVWNEVGNVRLLVDQDRDAGQQEKRTTPRLASLQKQEVKVAISSREAEEEDLPLPRFLRDYIEYHNRHAKSHSNHEQRREEYKYLIWHCGDSCGGAGDRLKGIVSAFYTALCSHRIFLIDWPDPTTNHTATTSAGLDQYLHPHKIEWRPSHSPLSFSWDWKNDAKSIGKVKRMHGYNSPVLKNLQPPRHLTNYTVLLMKTNRWYQDEMPDKHWYGGHQHGIHESLWYANNSQCLQTFWAHEEYNSFFQNDHFLFQTAFDILFQVTPLVHQAAQTIQRTAGLPSALSSSSSYLAMHIRTGGHLSTFDDPGRHSSVVDYQKFYHCAKKLQQTIWQQQHTTCTTISSFNTKDRAATIRDTTEENHHHQQQQLLPIYVASDNANVKNYVQQLELNDEAYTTTPATTTTIRTVPNLTLYHIDKSHETTATHVDAIHILRDPKQREGELTVWAELVVLRQATCVITSTSGFSQLATWLQRQKPRQSFRRHPCAIHFENCQDNQRVKQVVEDSLLDDVCTI